MMYKMKIVLGIVMVIIFGAVQVEASSGLRKINLTVVNQSDGVVMVKEGLVIKTDFKVSPQSSVSIPYYTTINMLKLDYDVHDQGFKQLSCTPQPEAIYTHSTTVTVQGSGDSLLCTIDQAS